MAQAGPLSFQVIDNSFSTYQSSGDLNGLREAIRKCTSALATVPDGDSRCNILVRLICLRRSLAMRTGHCQDFEDAIAIGEDALKTVSLLENKTERWWNVHAQLAAIRYHRDNLFPDLDQFRSTEKLLREFQRERGCDDPMMPNDVMIVNTYGLLGASLTSRYELLSSPYPEEVEHALDWSFYGLQRVKELSIPENDPGYAEFYYHFSIVLFAHFHGRGISHSLKDALKFSELALEVNANYIRGIDNDRFQSTLLSLRGAILEAGYQHYKKTDSIRAHQLLDEAIECADKIPELLKPDDHSRVPLQLAIGSWYCSIMERDGYLLWGEIAIQCLEKVLNLSAESTVDVSAVKAHILQTQAKVLVDADEEAVASETQVLTKMDEAMLEISKAIKASRGNDKRLGSWYRSLADLQMSKFSHLSSTDKMLRWQAKHNYATAANVDNSALSVRLAAALQSAVIHLDDGEVHAAHDILQKAISLLPEVANQVMSSQDAQEALRPSSGLAEYAASVVLLVAKTQADVLQDEKPVVRALRTLESSRCLISGESMKLKIDLAALGKENYLLAGRYRDSRMELAKATQNLRNPDEYYRSRQIQMNAFTSLADLNEQIRELDVFKNFQQPLTEEEMKGLASEGPIVTINVSRVQADAIIVTTDDVVLVELPGLTHEALHKRMAELDWLSDGSRRDMKSREPRGAKGKEAASLALLWLWDVAVEPILKSTTLTTSKRVWWITSGIIGRAPLHAAGDHSPGSTRNTISQVKSSYISSFRALRYARSRNARAAASNESRSLMDSKMLFIAVPKNPPGHRDLDTSAEQAAVEAIFAPPGDDGYRLTHLDPPIPEYVVELMSKQTFVHFACHGKSVGYNPSQSGLLLLDANKEAAMLTVVDLETVLDFDRAAGSMTAAQNAGLVAYLSACSTAEIDSDGQLGNEAINLGNAFQSLGFRNVIATLFGANDAAAGEIAGLFYASLVNGESEHQDLDVAEALHHATLSYRAAYAGTKEELSWVPFIHIGA